MAKKDKKKEMCSLDEELMMCSAYRYAVGRHTYISTLADYIAKEYYHRLTPERLAFTAKDLRSTIDDQLRFGGCSLHYDGTVSYDDRDGLDDLLTWMSDNVSSEKDLEGIERIEVYKESYAKDAPKKFRVYRVEPVIKHYYSQMDIDDLLNWHALANVFDKSRYKKLHVKYNGKEEDVVAVQCWRRAMVEIENQPGYCKIVEWKWVKCWKSVEDFIAKGEYAGYIVDDYIVSVDDYVEPAAETEDNKK